MTPQCCPSQPSYPCAWALRSPHFPTPIARTLLLTRPQPPQSSNRRKCTVLELLQRALVAPAPARRTGRCSAAGRLDQQTVDLVQQWLALDQDSESRAAVERLAAAGEARALHDMLGARLEFGTAGLRGKMGPGFNRMNSVTVQQTTQGLCRYLQQQEPDQLERNGVVIGYDARHGSRQFAELAAAVFLSQGVRTLLFDRLVPTPFVAAAVTRKGCAAGVMVTASHNPKEYNGYKVFWGNGCQIIPPHDAGIAAAILAHLDLWTLPPDTQPGRLRSHPLLQDPFEEVQAHYYRQLGREFSFRRARNGTAARLVYTPLHGVGAPFVLRAFEEWGLPAPLVVREQAEPDPEFPTVPFPNPEEGPGTWALALAAADAEGARVAIANDPDADRFAAAERDEAGHWRTFSGNEVGVLLAHWLWTQFRQRNLQVAPGQVVLLSSAVSSRQVAGLAAAHGLAWRETLTGFKWLSHAALDLTSQGFRVLLSYEEALGYMFTAPGGAPVNDKDGVAAAVIFAEMTAELYEQGISLAGQLEKIAQLTGHYEYRSGYFVAPEPAASRAVFERLRVGGQYPQAVGGVAVESVRDLGAGLDSAQPGGAPALAWQPGDMMVTLRLAGSGWATLRASGTEPKLKWYLEVKNDDPADACAAADRLQAAVADELVQPRRHGLTLPAMAGPS